jgi:hypothetical protein
MRNLLMIIFLLLSIGSVAQKKFVKSADSKHIITSIADDYIKFDGRDYYIHPKRGWYKSDNDSITWVYGHSKDNWADMVKIGFYNDRKGYVISIQTEKKFKSKTISYAKN